MVLKIALFATVLCLATAAGTTDNNKPVETKPRPVVAPRLNEVIVEPRFAAPMRVDTPVFYEQPRMVYQEPRVVIEEPVRVVAPPPKFGYDNYGNAIPEHPYAYINDDQGTRAIDPEITHGIPTHPAVGVSYANYFDANPYNDYPVLVELP
jgi:hypothetical protein